MELLSGLLVAVGAVVAGIIAWLKSRGDKQKARAETAEKEVQQTKKVIENVQKRQEIEQASNADTSTTHADRLRKQWSRD